MDGKENWKWGAVFLLLAIFLITANQAYKSITSQEDFEAPTDWMEGDSYDIEQRKNANAAMDQNENASSNESTEVISPNQENLSKKEEENNSVGDQNKNVSDEETTSQNPNDKIKWDNL